MAQIKWKVAILGGGASGLASSIIIKQKLGELVDVTVVERMERVGKKILSTGGGKANILNAKPCNNFTFNHPDFMQMYLKKYNYKKILKWFLSIGLVTTELNEGRIYPKSESANSVLDTIRLKMKDLGVHELCNFEVKRISFVDNKYKIESTRMTSIEADFVILAFGGKSSPMLGSNGSCFDILKKMKIDVTPIYPGLTGLKVEESVLKGLDGLRSKAKVSLFVKKQKEPYYVESGEIQFKNNALSGIVMMNVSSIISRLLVNKNETPSHISIDLLPEYSSEELKELLIARQKELNSYSNINYLLGIFSKMLAQNILKRARISLDGNVHDLDKRDLNRIVDGIKKWDINFISVDTFEHSQVSVGGININEVKIDLELVKYPRMFVTGELLDIDALCGGYNLEWAWISSMVAANAICQRIKDM